MALVWRTSTSRALASDVCEQFFCCLRIHPPSLDHSGGLESTEVECNNVKAHGQINGADVQVMYGYSVCDLSNFLRKVP